MRKESVLLFAFTVFLSFPAYAFLVDGAFKNAVKAVEKNVVGKAVIRRITKFEKELIQSGKITKVNNKKVSQRNQTFDKDAKNAKGQTNCELMLNGNAPLGHDSKPVELHHMKQESDGLLVEMMSSEHHNENSSVLHRYTAESEIDRAEWDKWRKGYWKERGKQLCK